MSSDVRPDPGHLSSGGRGVLEGAFRLLRVLPEVTGPHQLRDLAAATGVPRASVYRLMGQLREVGAVEFHDHQYLLSPTMLNLARKVEPFAGLRHHTADVLQNLRESTGATVTLIVSGERGTVALEVVPGRLPLPIEVYAGRGMPERTAGAEVINPRSTTARTIGHSRRIAVDDEGVVPNLTCYATSVPLPDGSDAALAVISPAAVPADGFADVVHRAATLMSRRLQRADAARRASELTPH